MSKKTQRLSFNLDPELHEKLRRIAVMKQITMTDVAIEVFEKYVEKEQHILDWYADVFEKNNDKRIKAEE